MDQSSNTNEKNIESVESASVKEIEIESTNTKKPETVNEPKNPRPKKPPQKRTNNNQKKSRGSKIGRKMPNEPWRRDVQKSIVANTLSHEKRLKSFDNIPFSKNRIKIIPLGGLGEIGGNIMVIESANSAIIVDVGMSFPDEDMHGVDILVPDFTYLRQIKDKIAGIVITHAHEDHIGAIPYLFREMKFPIYATPLPLGIMSNKFDEHQLRKEKNLFRPVEKRVKYKIGDFEVEWIHVTHSVIDASCLAITTEIGTIIHTGDFKIDHTPIDGYPTDIHRLAHYGEQGVLCLLSDSTNSYNKGFTKSESSVGPTFDQIFAKAKGRVLMSTFSSNIHRVAQAIESGLRHNRKVCVIGRSMERNIGIAMDLGYLKLDPNIFIDAHEIGKYSDKDVLIITTGSQGEMMSALYRIATEEHRFIRIKTTDQIIISARAIPGNEASVSRVLNYLMKSGAKVAYQDFSEIHVSGHGAQEEQKLMLRLTKPKFFLPVHGEYNHISKHKETAIQCGVQKGNIYLMSDGDQIEISQKYMKKLKSVKTGKTFIDNQKNKQIDHDVVMDRKNLAEAGIVSIIAQIDKAQQKLINRPKVITYGLVSDRDAKEFSREMESILEQFLTNTRKELFQNPRAIENGVRGVVRKHIFRKMKKYPTIVPTLFIM